MRMTAMKKKLKPCPYCGGKGIVSTHEDLNYKGLFGFVCTVRCNGCSRSISIWSPDKKIAEERAMRYWDGE